ncbi:hypothetical protein BaRGS_00028351 [Batillaria attramentaria]|uniref:Uncharacterized protein n=1 Tax=Batillaria attramentaria TaxID=370345 RepID=A0ABD0K036_9CAEN
MNCTVLVNCQQHGEQTNSVRLSGSCFVQIVYLTVNLLAITAVLQSTFQSLSLQQQKKWYQRQGKRHILEFSVNLETLKLINDQLFLCKNTITKIVCRDWELVDRFIRMDIATKPVKQRKIL